MPWKPGQSGNPGGVSKEKKFLAALERAVASEDGKKLRLAAEKLLDCAVAGESWAIQQLADRLDGRATQQIEMNVHRDVKDLSIDELLSAIAAERTAGAKASAAAPSELH